ncbi:Zn peptidase [Blautia sp. An81]|nr:Zn peptidase [Blautia sp. An81]
MVNRDIKRLVAYYVKKFGTRDPFRIADNLNVLYQFGDIGCEGCYMYLKRHRYIFLNANLDGPEKEMVMAHELGHAVLHRRENCYFIRNKTFLSTVRIEREANTFAAELLIPDSLILENPGYTKSQLARLAGYNEMIMEFKKID